MTDQQYINAIHEGHYLYWDMLGGLRGITNHKETHLRWLTGDVCFNYFCDTTDVESTIRRIENDEIPKTLSFNIDNNDNHEDGLIKAYRATGRFKDCMQTTGMAHELLDVVLPKPDSRLNLFRMRENAQLKQAGAILNAAFEYRLFSFGHYAEMFENNGQYFYLAEYEGLPVGACMAQHGDRFVNISWVGVLPGYRKLGIAGYLIQMAESDGIKNGKTIGVLGAFPDAVGAYRRVGYKGYCTTTVLELA
ncbi:MAG: GNAT family N-acetyltransferase [Defluviitaleaceae bacterium]|nr:GNAT family N-acetyltransferase [Defluviitaleaceae bacterium]